MRSDMEKQGVGSMSEEVRELAKRVVACASFRPMRGMSDEGGEVIVDVFDDGRIKTSELVESGHGYETYQEPWVGTFEQLLARYWLPDLNDPATLGCLLVMTATAHGSEWDSGAWLAAGDPLNPYNLVAALEAAPTQETT